MALLDLPLELLAAVVLALDLRDILGCRYVCKTLRGIVDRTVSIQYKIELAAYGMEDGPSELLSVSERFDLLRKHRTAWENLAWTDDFTIPMLTGQVWELYGNVLSQGHGPSKLSFWQLPSKLRNIPSREWDVSVDHHIRDYGMDPSQDLLVTIEVAPSNPNRSHSVVHFQNLTNGGRHPLATHGSVECNLDDYNLDWTYTVQISGDHVGILYQWQNALGHVDHDKHTLLVWNWRQGQELMRVRTYGMQSFTFIDEQHVLIGACPRWNIGEEADDTRSAAPILLVYQLADSSAVSENKEICQFLYPQLDDEDSSTYYIGIRADPAPSWTPPDSQQVPFHTTRGERIFVIDFYTLVGNGVRRIVHFVPLALIRRHVKRCALLESRLTPRIKWAEWGPETHMTEEISVPRVWVCYVFGSRFVSVHQRRVRGNSIEPEINLWDFNQLAYRRDQMLKLSASAATDEGAETGDPVNEAADDDSWIDDDAGWEYFGSDRKLERGLTSIFNRKEFTGTFLPHRKTKRQLPRDKGTFPPRHVMLSEDNLVVMDVSNSGGRLNRILSF